MEMEGVSHIMKVKFKGCRCSRQIIGEENKGPIIKHLELEGHELICGKPKQLVSAAYS